MSGDESKDLLTGDTVEDYQIGFSHGVSRTTSRMLEWAEDRKKANLARSLEHPIDIGQAGYDQAMSELIAELEAYH